MRCGEIIEAIQSQFPPSLAEEWDNSGLQVGPFDNEVKRIGIALNASLSSLNESINRECDFLLTHHPLIFRSLRRVDLSSELGQLIALAVSRRITIYALHTPWDSYPGGSSDYWADLLGLRERDPLSPLREFPQAGIGRIGEVEPMLFEDVISFLRRQVKFMIPVGDRKAKVRKVAICAGSGGDLLERVVSLRGDLYITSDLKYHQILQAMSSGVNVVLLSHHEMEESSLIYLVREIKKLLPRLEVELIRERDPLSS